MAEGIREGFLCPICHKDLRSPNSLIAHFQDQHSEEQDILKSIKDFYGKAKKKILKLEEQDLESYKQKISLEKLYLDVSEPQEPGQVTSYTDYFKAVRRECLDHRTSETNKLIIRLDRLLRFNGSDRKQQEQELVPWLDGTTVSRCPCCATVFNIARRQHHCRLCGSIMCSSCSYFLTYEIAQTIVASIRSKETNGKEHMKESDTIRVCSHCLLLVENRRKAQMEQMIQPIICQLYSHLQKLKGQTQTSVDLYLKMHSSLTSGESTYQLQEIQSLRSNIAKQAEMIDTLSKKICSLSDAENRPQAEALQNSIRRATSHYIKEYLVTLPTPPSTESLDRIRRELRLTQSEEEDIPQPKQDIKRVAVTTGWSPRNVEVEETEDPLIEQMNIVRNYIEQARQAKRFDEVASLQANLKFLKETYRQQKK